MVFSSIVFLFYFLPAILLLYYTVGCLHLWVRNILLLAASLVFYAWGEPKNIVLLIGSCVVNWLLALCISAFPRAKKPLLVLDCAVNLGVLFVFKYLNFTLQTADVLTEIMGIEVAVPVTNIALPIGISFFTFQALSYVIDVYRGDVQAQKNPLSVALYISLFPQLVAGPIVRYHTVAEQLVHRKHTLRKFEMGVCRFVQGLGKKLLLANTFAVIADNIFQMTLAGHVQMKIPVMLAWLGAIAYTLQIFFDFSGYSDMAIGLGKMFGFTFEENFRYPYISKSISEFWRRWHISLSTWFREYVYFPLGGSRVENADLMVRNLLLVWLLTGLWHGASWTFVVWGLFNFLLILLERLLNFEKTERVRPAWKHCYALLMINLSWVLFRSESFYHYKEYMGNLLGLNRNGIYSSYVWMLLKEYWIFWLVGVLLCVPVGGWLKKKLAHRKRLRRISGMVLYPLGMCMVLALCVIYLVKGGYNPFIYFNF